MLNDNRIRALAALALITIAVWAYALAPAGHTLSLTVMDVGEGLCIVMRSPNGKTLVMDCGTNSWRNNDDVGKSLVLPYLRKMGVRQIDVAVISHPHEDHISGFEGLLQNCPAKLVIDTKSSEHSPTYNHLKNEIRRSGATYRFAKRGQTIEFDDGVIIQVLNPPSASEPGQDLNEESIVLRVIYGKTAFLLAGDIGNVSESEIMNENLPIRAQALQVGHHGSHQSTSYRWLEAVKPNAAVISCGRNNTYGHPAEETLERLTDSGTRVYRTDKNGAVSFYSDGNSIKVNAMVSH
ncbi:MAG: ComEC/Rec2 family competence protein [Armatimonadetes bacterium]|nr:ComEC/Rec2 family competence protein [Armatimonadota bacterium]